MYNKEWVPKTNQDMMKWYYHVEQCLRGQASKFKQESVQAIDRNYIADGIKYIRMRDFPRFITLPEATELDDLLKKVGVPRDWLFEVCRISRYGQMTEAQHDEIMTRTQTWVDLYKKYISLENDEKSTLQEALVEEANLMEAGLPKSFLKECGV